MLLALGLIAAAIAGGCGSDEPSGQEQIDQAAEDVQSAIDKCLEEHDSLSEC